MVALGWIFQKAFIVMYTPLVNFLYFTYFNLFSMRCNRRFLRCTTKKPGLLCSRSLITCKEIMVTGLEKLCFSYSEFLIVLFKFTEWTAAGTTKSYCFMCCYFQHHLGEFIYFIFLTIKPLSSKIFLMNKRWWKFVYKVFCNFSISVSCSCTYNLMGSSEVFILHAFLSLQTDMAYLNNSWEGQQFTWSLQWSSIYFFITVITT